MVLVMSHAFIRDAMTMLRLHIRLRPVVTLSQLHSSGRVLCLLLYTAVGVLPSIAVRSEELASGLPGSVARVEDHRLQESFLCLGVGDQTASLQSAINANTASGKAVVISGAKGPCLVTKAIYLPSKTDLIGTDGVVIKSVSRISANLLDLTGSYDVTVRGVNLDGSSLNLEYSVFKPVIIFSNTQHSRLENLTIKNTVRDIRISSGSNNNTIKNVSITNPGGYNGLTVEDSNDNVIEDFRSVGQRLWGIGIIGTSSRNHLIRPSSNDSGAELVGIQWRATENEIVDPRLEFAKYPTWLPGMTMTKGERRISLGSDGMPKIYIATSDGVSGRYPPTCIGSLMTIPDKVTCTDGGVIWAFWREYNSAGDNCISVTGSHNVIKGGTLDGCKRNGIALFGENNTVSDVAILNPGQGLSNPGGQKYACIYFNSNYNGVSKYNVVNDNRCLDNQKRHTMYYGIWFDSGYPDWTTHNLYRLGDYVENQSNLYKATIGGLSGNSPPNCREGECDDGAISWTWTRQVIRGATEANVARHNLVEGTVSSVAICKSTNRLGEVVIDNKVE